MRLPGRRARRPGADRHRGRGHVIRELAGRPALERCARRSRTSTPTSARWSPAACCSASSSTAASPSTARATSSSAASSAPTPRRAPSPSARRSRPGTVVRLHARDAGSADRDLREALGLRIEALGGGSRPARSSSPATAAGAAMFGTPDHDAVALDEELARRARARASSPRARSAPSAASPSCTASPRRWRYSRREPRRADRPAHRRDGRARPRHRARACTRRAPSSSSPAAAPTCSSRSPPRPARARCAADLADRRAVQRLASDCADVDVLVANAGLPGSGPLTSFTVEQIDRALAVNLRAPIVLARVLAERMVARGSGHIVFMSSLAGKAGTPRSPSTARRSSACAASRRACARTCARAASA